MKRPWQVALLFAVAAAVLLAAMAWISSEVLRLDRAQAEAKRLALQEENVRLALWRMESALALLTARERARPPADYTAFRPVDARYADRFRDGSPGKPLPEVPSSVLVRTSPYVRLHFQIDAQGGITSPQAPPESQAAGESAFAKQVSVKNVSLARSRLERLRTLVSRETLEAALAGRTGPPSASVTALATTDPQQEVQESAQAPQQERPQPKAPAQGAQRPAQTSPQQKVAQAWRNIKEWQARQQQIDDLSRDINLRIAGNLDASGAAGVTVMRPLWIEGELFLVRWARIEDADYLQGVWLDWPAIRTWLLDGVRDLVPLADLAPITGDPDEDQTRWLAALPVRIIPGKVPARGEAGLSPVALSLVVAWLCVLGGAAAVGLLLTGAVRLSERRGDFVSAVTHELRTPLTTFRMYSEMLAEDMVTDEDRRRQYLTTLRAEAERLTHMVENVLAYARLERGRVRDEAERVPLAELLDRVRDRLETRTQGAGMDLVVETPAGAAAAVVWARVSAVEQILYNLVDNACKYAASAADRRVHLTVALADGDATLTVRDYGPGISRAEARRLFRPFSKSAQQAAVSAPGVGLGLALAHRLARDMGGDLRLERPGAEGAAFALHLLRA
jgi:signal transduction histidine kinase